MITNYDAVSDRTLVNQGYYINEMGLYARPFGGSEETEVLYSIAVISSETGDFMPPYNGYHPAEIIQEYYATVSSSADVTIQRNMGAAALADDLRDTNLRVDSLETSRTWFWNCGNRKADTEKMVDAEGFRLFQGARIVVHFQWGNTAENITLNVNGTGAAPIHYNGAAIPSDYIRTGHMIEFLYYGDCWNVVGDLTQAQVDGLSERLENLTPSDIGALPSSCNAVSASKWNTPRKINGMNVDGTADRINYGICSTSGSTAAKTVSCTGFSLVTGAEITVKFNHTNTALNPTLSVNGTGAKAVYYKGVALPSGHIVSNGTYTFRYNGTQWEFVGDLTQEQVDKLDTEVSRLRGEVSNLKTEIGELKVILSSILEKMDISIYNGMLWTYYGSDSIRKASSYVTYAKCAIVQVESNAVYKVVTHRTDYKTSGVFDVLEAVSNNSGSSEEYSAAQSPLVGIEGTNTYTFRTQSTTKYLLINSGGLDFNIEVYRLKI